MLIIRYANLEVCAIKMRINFILLTFNFRFVQCGWTGARSWDMCQIYDSLPMSERHRIEKIEMLDEGELLVQLFQHYCITVAWIGELFQDIEIT